MSEKNDAVSWQGLFKRERPFEYQQMTIEEKDNIERVEFLVGDLVWKSVVDECVSVIESCELVEPNVMRIRLHEAIGALMRLRSNTK